MEIIPFNKPYVTGNETKYIERAVKNLHLSGNGEYTKRCQSFFQDRFGFPKALMTTSCTDALEMAAILLDIKPGDEVIMPSFTFVSTANAFVLRGAKIVFVDSREDHPGMDESLVEELITPRTKAVVCVHYAGVACDMDVLLEVCERRNIYLIEDAAQAIDSKYKGGYLGSFGDLATFSFHETKNIQCGEGGMLVINNSKFEKRAEIIWEKGTNRAAFFRGEVDKYGWVDLGSSFLPSELNAAFLWAQLEALEDIQKKRLSLWYRYYDNYNNERQDVNLPVIPEYASNNAHMFYRVFESGKARNQEIKDQLKVGVHTVFHYQSLHKSPFFRSKHDGRELNNCEKYSDGLLRYPLHYHLSASTLLLT